MNKLILSFLLLAPGISSAKFYLPEDLPVKPANLENAVKSLAYLKSTYSGDKCSGVFVSEDGYYVTALHCMESCMRQHHLFSNSDPKNQYDHPGPAEADDFHKIYNSKFTPGSKIICEDVEVSFPGLSILFSNAEIVMLGRGWSTVKSDGIDQLTEEQFKNLQNGIDDFAVLKFPLKEKANCLKVSKNNQAGTNIWTMGYPTETKREEGFNSDGRSRLASMGVVRGSIDEDTYLKTLPMSSLAWQRQELLTGDPKYMLMTNDVVSQMSGGTVIDDNGDAVAVIYSSNAKDSTTLPFWGTSFATKLDYIRDRTTKATGKNVFTCGAQVPGS